MFRVTTRLFLGVDELVVEGYLEHTAPRRRQNELVEIVLELLQQPLRQTDGSRCVSSLSAVLDRYPHNPSLGASL